MESLLRSDPVSNCFLDARLRGAGLDPWRLGGDIWGYLDDDTLHSVVYVGANLVPVGTTPASRAALVDRLRMSPRRCSSFVGDREEVLDLWRLLEPAWGPAREVRDDQRLLVMDTDANIPHDPHVRMATLADMDVLLPACVDMFTEEVGISPVRGGGGSAYRDRVAEIVRAGRSFVRIVDGRIEFKAEIGAATPDACQVQGVWVAPELRGRGMSVPAMASVIHLARSAISPTVSLYVNSFNTPAMRSYASVGFRPYGHFATVLF
ncbi:GNAT family N-acetyltransferase [Actinomycetota bacterium]|nr:GNAT family N-acetyltransferase [Actinomycetota bacterium]